MKNRVKIGDIIEIKTKKGLAYAQFSHRHAQYGALIRVLPGFFQETPINFTELASIKESFVTFFPLQAAVNRSIVHVVSNCKIPDFAKSFPLFRTGIEDSITRKVKVWWLWDGINEWKIDKLTDEQYKLPLRGIWNDTLLIERIESGWTPTKDK
ncbi:MAG: hypothetical protein WC666_02625 [Candidatus Paceibacterota bacterium]|jgi:hypothetical protein